MLRAGALMAALLVLVPFTGWSVRGRLLVLCEVWPGHLKEYQQLSIATDNDSYRTSVNRTLEQSALKKDNRNYKSFRTNFKIHGKNAFKNHQQKYAVLFRINLYLLADRKTSIQISKKHLVTNEVILREINYLRRRLNILMNANLEDCEVKMNWLINVRKKSEGNKSQVSYFEKGHKYMETKSPLSYMAHQTNTLKSEEQLPKYQKSLGSIIVLKFVKQHKGEEHTEMKSLKKKKYKNNIDRLLASVKEKFCKVNTNVYNKNQHRIFSDGKKLFNTEIKNQYIGIKRLQQGKNVIKEKIKMWKQKTITKKSVYENQKLQFRHVFTYQRNSHRLQKVYSTHKKMLSDIQRKKVPAYQTKTFRGKHLIRKWGSILRARKESKFGENEMGILSKNYYMQPFITNLKFLTITMYVKQDFFSSEKYQTKPLVQVKKMLQYLLPSSGRVKKKYFSLGQKGLEMSTLKTLMVKRLVKKEGFPAFFYKDIFNGLSSIVERTKRSAKDKTVSISVDVLQHLSSALIAGATIFGIALFIIALAGFYLYLKRRQLLKFFNTVLKDGKSPPKSKSTDSQSYTPISVSQNFHFVQPKDSRKKQTAVAAAVEACTKEKSDCVSVKEIYDSSDTEGSSKMSHKGLTVRSRAYVFPSRSSGSLQSFCDDVCDVYSAQLSLSDEIVVEKLCSNRSSTTPKQKAVAVACQTNHCSKDNQHHCTNTDVSPQLKQLTISRSKSENDIIRASSNNTSRPVQSSTYVSKVQNP